MFLRQVNTNRPAKAFGSFGSLAPPLGPWRAEFFALPRASRLDYADTPARLLGWLLLLRIADNPPRRHAAWA
jgi:hypothetical protein